MDTLYLQLYNEIYKAQKTAYKIIDEADFCLTEEEEKKYSDIEYIATNLIPKIQNILIEIADRT